MPVADNVIDFITAHWRRLPKRPQLDELETQAATFIIEALDALENVSFEVFTEEFYTRFEDDTKDLSWTLEDEEYHNITVYKDVVNLPGQQNLIEFSKGVFVELSKVQEAVAYYGSKSGISNNGSRIRPTFESMKSKFRFIKDRNHLQKIRGYEKAGELKFHRGNNLKFISNELEKVVRKHLEEGNILHDSTLRYLIAEIINKNNVGIKFSVSDEWIRGWKRRFGLSSTKITKFVANVRHKSREQIEQESKDFVTKTNQDMALYPHKAIFNADQSGFQLEMHTARTLAFTGSQHVHCVVQNVSSTTHSYTVLPLISAEGKLHKKLFVTLKEPNGQFPKKGHYKAPNLLVTCHSSHIMTKNLMKTFFEKIMFDDSMPQDAFLLVDSWSSWKDQVTIDSITPASNKLKVSIIPPGCTGYVQPCDVGIFGAFKKVVKTITGQAQLAHIDYKIYARDPTLKMLSLVWWKLCSP